jgi:hypothetical protein
MAKLTTRILTLSNAGFTETEFPRRTKSSRLLLQTLKSWALMLDCLSMITLRALLCFPRLPQSASKQYSDTWRLASSKWWKCSESTKRKCASISQKSQSNPKQLKLQLSDTRKLNKCTL